MQFGHLLAGGLLAAGLVVTAGDDPHRALMKLLHGGADTEAGSASLMQGGADMAALHLLHEALDRVGLEGERRVQLHERLASHATPLHDSLAQLISARDAHLHAVLAVPLAVEALTQSSQDLARAQEQIVGLSVELHLALQESLDAGERVAFDAAREALLAEAEARHEELSQQIRSGAFGPQGEHALHEH
jgi:hypothetical protein